MVYSVGKVISSMCLLFLVVHSIVRERSDPIHQGFDSYLDGYGPG